MNWRTPEYRLYKRIRYARDYKSLTHPQRRRPTTCSKCGEAFSEKPQYRHHGYCYECKKIDMKKNWEMNSSKYNFQRRERYRKDKEKINAHRREKYRKDLLR